MPSRYTESNYNVPSLLDITGSILTVLVTVGVLRGIVSLTLLVPNKKIRGIGEFAAKLMIYTGLIRLAMAACIYFMIGLMLNFRYGINSSAISIVNTFLSFVSLFLLLGYVY